MKPRPYLTKRATSSVNSELEVSPNLPGKFAYFILKQNYQKIIGLKVDSRSRYKSYVGEKTLNFMPLRIHSDKSISDKQLNS